MAAQHGVVQEIFEESAKDRLAFKVSPTANHALLHTMTGKLDETESWNCNGLPTGISRH